MKTVMVRINQDYIDFVEKFNPGIYEGCETTKDKEANLAEHINGVLANHQQSWEELDESK